MGRGGEGRGGEGWGGAARGGAARGGARLSVECLVEREIGDDVVR